MRDVLKPESQPGPMVRPRSLDPETDPNVRALMRQRGEPRRLPDAGEYFRRMIEAEDAARGWHGLRPLQL